MRRGRRYGCLGGGIGVRAWVGWRWDGQGGHGSLLTPSSFMEWVQGLGLGVGVGLGWVWCRPERHLVIESRVRTGIEVGQRECAGVHIIREDRVRDLGEGGVGAVAGVLVVHRCILRCNVCEDLALLRGGGQQFGLACQVRIRPSSGD